MSHTLIGKNKTHNEIEEESNHSNKEHDKSINFRRG